MLPKKIRKRKSIENKRRGVCGTKEQTAKNTIT
jgi:hypothetical protein